MPATEAVTAKQLAAALKGVAAEGIDLEAEFAREVATAKGAAAGAGAKAVTAGAGVKGAGAAATGAKAMGAAATGAKASSAGGFLSAGKGLGLKGLGLGLGVWGPVLLGLVAAAAIYGYIRSRHAGHDSSDQEVELADALAEG